MKVVVDINHILWIELSKPLEEEEYRLLKKISKKEKCNFLMIQNTDMEKAFLDYQKLDEEINCIGFQNCKGKIDLAPLSHLHQINGLVLDTLNFENLNTMSQLNTLALLLQKEDYQKERMDEVWNDISAIGKKQKQVSIFHQPCLQQLLLFNFPFSKIPVTAGEIILNYTKADSMPDILTFESESFQIYGPVKEDGSLLKLPYLQSSHCEKIWCNHVYITMNQLLNYPSCTFRVSKDCEVEGLVPTEVFRNEQNQEKDSLEQGFQKKQVKVIPFPKK